MFILAELVSPTAILHSLSISHVYGKLIITINIEWIIINKFINNQLEENQRIRLRRKVLAICKCKLNPFKNDVVVYMDENYSIWMLHFNDELAISRMQIDQISDTGRHLSSECPPAVVPQKYDNPEYIVFYLFDEVFTVFTFNNDYDRAEIFAEKQDTKRKRKTNPGLWTPWNGKLGNIIVQKIISLSNPNASIAVLYRDTNSICSMRYIQLNDGSSTIIKQFSEFEQVPSLIIPMEQGGHLAIDTNVYYFPPPNKRVTLSTTMDSNVMVSDKMNYLILSMGASEKFVSFDIIDEKRTLISAESGVCFMIFLDIQPSSSFLIVNDMKLIQLGKITSGPSNALHHIENNKFFASSRTSKSVVFSISSDMPYLKTVSTVEINPPVIDMFTSTRNERVEIYTCQGGNYGSELRKYKQIGYFLEHIQTKQLDFKVLATTIFGNHIVINGKEEQAMLEKLTFTTTSVEKSPEFIDCYTNGDSQWLITKDNITRNGTNIYKGSFTFGKTIKGTIAIITQDNQLHILQEEYPVIVVPLDKGPIIGLDLGMKSPSEVIIMVSSSVSYKIWHISGIKQQVIFEEKLDSNRIFCSAVLVQEDGFVSIILSLENGAVHIQFPLSNPHEVSRHSFHTNSKPFSIAKYESDVLLFNFDGIFTLKRDPIIKQYFSSFHQMRGIVDVKFISENRIIVSFQDRVSLFEYNIRPSLGSLTFQSLEFEQMCFKCIDIPDTHYCIVLTLDANETTMIVLIDKESLQILDKYEAEFEIKHAVFLPLEDSTEYQWFITLFDSSKHFGIFRIKDNKIELVQELAISNYNFDELLFDSIELMDKKELTYILYGQICLVVQVELDTSDPFQIKWEVIPRSIYNVPTYAISTVIADNTMLVGDVVKGIFKCDIEDPRKTFVKVGIEHQYLTSMDIVAFNKLRYLVSGDSLGNIAIVNLLNEVIACQFNLNDQINMIKSVKEAQHKLAIIATVSGGLYLLSESDSKFFESSGKKIMKNLEQFGTSVTHWKVLDKDIEELDDGFAPFDERVSTEFLGNLNCMENNQQVEIFASTFKQSYRHKQLLQDIHHQCHSL